MKEKEQEEEEEASGDGGSIKESTLRYNKVHPRKPSALFAPALLPLFSWQQQHYAIQLTLFLNFINFSLGLGGASARSCYPVASGGYIESGYI